MHIKLRGCHFFLSSYYTKASKKMESTPLNDWPVGMPTREESSWIARNLRAGVGGPGAKQEHKRLQNRANTRRRAVERHVRKYGESKPQRLEKLVKEAYDAKAEYLEYIREVILRPQRFAKQTFPSETPATQRAS